MTGKHTHRAQRGVSMRPFMGPARLDHQNPAAWGDRTAVSTCKCGAVRLTNYNGPHVERGPWQEIP